ncbi:carbohydrate esterase family 4 protein [Delphinella strobiligena]|nr:carbohydrate esterase family 4 protein [Delphinella strobiligena]
MSHPPTWPSGKKACITITMDNMGEAADLNRKIWPTTTPIGTHYSVLSSLPLMLAILEKYSIPTTYFIEAWNLEPGHYPDVVKDLVERGVEVGFHAYQHEVWKNLDERTEVRNLDLSIQNAEKLGVRYKGFRPPGGLVTERTLGLMRERGLRYLSPAAARPAIVEGVAMVPFQWEVIDAYFYMEGTRALRLAKEDSGAQLSPTLFKERVLRRIDEVVEEGGHLALLFHPFLTVGEERLEVMEEVLRYVRGRESEVWIAKSEDAAEWILEQGVGVFGSDPGWDSAEWKKD